MEFTDLIAVGRKPFTLVTIGMVGDGAMEQFCFSARSGSLLATALHSYRDMAPGYGSGARFFIGKTSVNFHDTRWRDLANMHVDPPGFQAVTQYNKEAANGSARRNPNNPLLSSGDDRDISPNGLKTRSMLKNAGCASQLGAPSGAKTGDTMDGGGVGLLI